IARAIGESRPAAGPIASAAAKPGVAVVFGHGPGTPAFKALRAAGVPAYTFPENAVRSLGGAHAVGAWQARPAPAANPDALPPGIDHRAAATLVANTAATGGGWMPMR